MGATAPAPKKTTAETAEMQSERQSILLVEDDEITRSLLNDILLHDGYAVSTAMNGRQALDHVRQSVPDLILSDVMMPEVNGLELFRRLQEDERLQELPFIFLTALDDGELLIRMKELGPDDYLVKPIRPKHLLATVKGKLLRKQRLTEKAERDQHRVRERIRWTLSHELRTPLTIIQGASELLLAECAGALDGDYRELLESIRSQALQLGSIIENFILVSRIDSGEEEARHAREAEFLSPAVTVDEAVMGLQDRATARGVELRVEVARDLPRVFAHRSHIHEAFHQLLDNAIKFADSKRGRVEVSGSVDAEWVRLTICDNGQGVSEQKQRYLFEKLSQVDREIHEQQGSGLGLYITKRLIEINPVKVALASRPGAGAELSIWLPTTRRDISPAPSA